MKRKSILPTPPDSVAIEIAAHSTPIEMSAQLHTSYRIHWRTELKWRNTAIEFSGHVDYTAALTPEAAVDKFVADFPSRAPVRIEAR